MILYILSLEYAYCIRHESYERSPYILDDVIVTKEALIDSLTYIRNCTAWRSLRVLEYAY